MPAAAAITVGTSATSLHTPATSATTVRVHNNGTNAIFVGESGVTTATGFPVAADAELEVTLAEGEQVYGIVAAGTEDARVIVTAVKGGA